MERSCSCSLTHSPKSSWPLHPIPPRCRPVLYRRCQGGKRQEAHRDRFAARICLVQEGRAGGVCRSGMRRSGAVNVGTGDVVHPTSCGESVCARILYDVVPSPANSSIFWAPFFFKAGWVLSACTGRVWNLAVRQRAASRHGVANSVDFTGWRRWSAGGGKTSAETRGNLFLWNRRGGIQCCCRRWLSSAARGAGSRLQRLWQRGCTGTGTGTGRGLGVSCTWPWGGVGSSHPS